MLGASPPREGGALWLQDVKKGRPTNKFSPADPPGEGKTSGAIGDRTSRGDSSTPTGYEGDGRRDALIGVDEAGPRDRLLLPRETQWRRALCEDCKKHQWYARALAQQLRDETEFGEHLTQSEKDARNLASYWIDRVFDDWPGKYVGMHPGGSSTRQQEPRYRPRFCHITISIQTLTTIAAPSMEMILFVVLAIIQSQAAAALLGWAL
jgi:hypothetical protein